MQEILDMYFSPFVLAPQVIAAFVALIFAWRVRGMKFSRAALAAGATNFAYGLLICVLMTAHTAFVTLKAVNGKMGQNDDEPFQYNFRFYSLMLVGGLFFLIGAKIMRTSKGIVAGDEPARTAAVKYSLLWLLLTVPMVGFQITAVVFISFGVFNLIILVLSRSAVACATTEKKADFYPAIIGKSQI